MSQNKQASFSCIMFYTFSFSFLILGIINCVYPISNFKMIILSAVAFLFSLQQLFEAEEEVANKIEELEKKNDLQTKHLDWNEYPAEVSPPKQKNTSKFFSKSRLVFATAMMIMVVGLALDISIQNSAVANALTIISFSAIFATMGFKEQFMARLNWLNESLYEDDQKIIVALKKEISILQKQEPQ